MTGLWTSLGPTLTGRPSQEREQAGHTERDLTRRLRDAGPPRQSWGEAISSDASETVRFG